MAVTSVVVTGSLPTADAAYTDFTSSGFGTPDAAIIFVSNANTTSNPQTDLVMSVGFWTSGAQGAATTASQNGQATSNSSRGQHTTSAAVTASPTHSSGFAVVYTASSTTDGIRITKGSGTTGVNRYCNVILIKGATSVAMATDTIPSTGSSKSITAPGFKPDLIFFAGAVCSSTSSLDQTAIMAVGVAHNNSSNAITQGCVQFVDTDGQSTAQTVSTEIRDDSVLLGASSLSANVSSADATGFTLGYTNSFGGARYFAYLAIKLPDPDDAYVGVIDSKTSTGTQAYTGTGFTPVVLGLIGTTLTTVNSSASSAVGSITYGAASGTGAQQSIIIGSEDAVGTSNTYCRYDGSNVLNLRDHADAVDAVAALNSFDSDGFTLNYSDGSASARKILAFAIGNSAGGGGATLTADSGSYALTGTAATLAVGRKLTAESGTYSVTGTSVDFLRGYSLTAESGGYSVSGTDAAIKLGRLLAAESGSYTLTGTEVTLTYQQAGSYSLTADAGSYALTGTAAALRVTRTLTAEAGSYSLAGTDVTLKRGYAVQADTGSYTLTGTAVAFARTYVLGAESGSYTLTGSDVGLTWSAAPVVETPTHGGPSIYGKAVFREKEFRREYDEQIRRIDEAKLAERLIREDEELIIIMAALAA